MSSSFDKIKDCINRDDVECLKQFVKTKQDANILSSTSIYTEPITPLWYAINKGAKKSAEFLIGKGADVNFRMKNSNSTLRRLVEKNWFDLAQKAVDNKLPITKEVLVDTLITLLQESGSGKYHNNQVIRFVNSLIPQVIGSDKILTDHLSSSEIDTLLANVTYHSSFEVFKHFMDTYIGDVSNYTNVVGNSLLHTAVETRDLDKVRYLVEKKSVSPNIPNISQETPLHTASEQLVELKVYNNYDLQKATKLAKIIEYLVSKSANLEYRSNNRQTPLDILVRQGITDIPVHLVSWNSPEYLPAKTRIITNLLLHLVGQGKLTNEMLKLYIPFVINTSMDQDVQQHKTLQREILTFPSREVLTQFLKNSLEKLCSESTN